MEPIRQPPDLLVRAKQYLAWDRFPDLAVQLIRLDRPVGYFFPKNVGSPTILLFYTDDRVREALFLLFHEAGHHVLEKVSEGSVGQELAREQQAWQAGRVLFAEFLTVAELPKEWILEYDAFARESLKTYSPVSEDEA